MESQLDQLRRMPADRAAIYARGLLAYLDWRPTARRDYSTADLALLQHLAGNEKLKYAKIETATQLKDAVCVVNGNPSDEQKDAGNYQKAHISWKGLQITVETAKGQYRRGIGKGGKPWQTLMKDNYGYIKRTLSEADGDQIDVFLCDDHLDSDMVFCVNQVRPSGRFDEHKFILGQNNIDDAKEAYLRNYEPGWKGCGPITPMTIDQFKCWLEDGDSGEQVEPLRYAKDHEDLARLYAAHLNDRLDAGGAVLVEQLDAIAEELEQSGWRVDYAKQKWEAKPVEREGPLKYAKGQQQKKCTSSIPKLLQILRERELRENPNA